MVKVKIIKSELLSVFYSSTFKVFIALNIALSILSLFTIGLGQNITKLNAQYYGMQILQVGATGSLLVSFLGVTLFTKEFGRGLIIRSVINAGSIRNVLKIKLAVSAIIGIIFGVVELIITVAGLEIWMSRKHVTFDWTSGSIVLAVRILLLVTFAAPWGTSVGWIGRGERATSFGFLFYRLLFTPIFIAFIPNIQPWLPGFSLNFRSFAAGSSISELFSGVMISLMWLAIDVVVGDILQRKKGYL